MIRRIPIISLIGANPQILTIGDTYTELGATAHDNIDGDLTEAIVIDDTAVNMNVVGDYNVTYDVSRFWTECSADRDKNSYRNASTRHHKSGDSLIGANPQILTVGGTYIELGATANDDVDGISQPISKLMPAV